MPINSSPSTPLRRGLLDAVCSPTTPFNPRIPDGPPGVHASPMPDLLLPPHRLSNSPSNYNSIPAKLLSDLDKLRPRNLKTEQTKQRLLLASIVWYIRYSFLCLIALIFLRPREDPFIWSFLSLRTTLYALFLIAKIHFIVLATRVCVLYKLLSRTKNCRPLRNILTTIPCRIGGPYLDISKPSFWLLYLLFELCLYVIRLFDRLMHHQLPSCVAGATRMPYKFKDVLRTLRLLDENEIQRRAFPDEVVFNINKSIKKGVSGPYSVKSVTPEEIARGLQVRAENIESDAIILAVSYAHKDRDIITKSLSSDAARGLCKALREARLPCDRVYLWSDITLGKNAFARDSWAEEGLKPYIAYPTIRIGFEETYWTEVELDLAHARNAQQEEDDILTFTRHLVARRRDRGLDEDLNVNGLLYEMRAVALGMRPETCQSRGLQCAINASLLVGPALSETTMVKKLHGHWDGASEFVDEGGKLAGDEHAYLKSSIALCTRLFILEKDKNCFSVWIYKDDFDDFVVVVAEMEMKVEGSYVVRRKARLTPPAKEQRQLLELHNSPTSEISHSRMTELLERAEIYVNIKNVGTRRIHPESIEIR